MARRSIRVASVLSIPVITATAGGFACSSGGGTEDTGGLDAAIADDAPAVTDFSPWDLHEPDDPGKDGVEVTDAPADAPPAGGPVVVNEVVASAVASGPDWVELYNKGSHIMDLTAWTIKDNQDGHVYPFPDGTKIAPGEFLVVEGPGGKGPYVSTYGFGKADSARLFNGTGVMVDAATWLNGQAPAGTSWGRYPDGTGPFATLPVPTKGKPNAKPIAGL